MSSLLEPVLSRVALTELPVLVLDCQATSSHPANGHLLEVAWSVLSADGTRAGTMPTSRLVRLPERVTVPDRARRVTGLTDDDLAAGHAPSEVFDDLAEAARTVAAANEHGLCLTVVHFSSFEERYLRALRYRSAPDAPFPFQLFCTHRLAKRLLPELPRLSLRAVAGYFGMGLPELRRASDHVSATAVVWKGCLALLGDVHGIHTLEGLARWLASSRAAPRPPRRSYPMAPEKWRRLPHEPGVYRMLRRNGDVLYVGKATSLRERVSSYFRAVTPHADHTLEMLSQACDLDVVLTGTALEAALYEAEEIQRLAPPYNKALRLRDRSLLFADGRLRSFSTAADPVHRIGPLPKLELLRAFTAVADRIEGARAGTEATGELLGCDVAALEAAFELFRARLDGSSLLAFGAREWLRRRDPEGGAAESEDEFRLELERVWDPRRRATPESALELLIEIVVRTSHLVRRAHWHRLLSRSTLRWEGRDGARRAISNRGDVSDVAAYDRLTVLTREIRRLVSEGREVVLEIPPEHRLDRTRLARVLRWI
jgi:DNA polymerase III subunit epsilon